MLTRLIFSIVSKKIILVANTQHKQQDGTIGCEPSVGNPVGTSHPHREQCIRGGNFKRDRVLLPYPVPDGIDMRVEMASGST